MLYRNFATQQEIDAQYDLGQVVGDPGPYFEFYVAESARARAELPCHLDVRFGPTVDETLDIFPAAAPDAPVVCFIHGGYWRRFSSKEFSFVAHGLVASGLTVVVTNYALCPRVSLSEITRQSRAAVAWIRRADLPFAGNRARLYVVGHSAGGQQAARVAATPWVVDYGLPADTVRGAYAISGLFDLTPLRYSFVQPALQLDGDTIRRESPLFDIPAVGPPLCADVGAEESAEFRRQSADFAAAWQAAGLRGSYAEQPGRNHFTAITDFAQRGSPLCEKLLAFIRECEG
jgi:arylformamidase